MSVSVKSQREIELMREAGRILAIVHEELAKIIEPGITTKHIDQVGYDIIKSYGCEPSFLLMTKLFTVYLTGSMSCMKVI